MPIFQNRERFEMVAKTFQGLEEVLAEELRQLGAEDVEPGRRMVSFAGTLETLYRANMCCRTALRILKPIHSFTASNPDELYDRTKEFDWTSLMTLDQTFSIDSVVYSDEFTHSRYVTYRVKDAIVDSFRDRYGADKRPGVRLQDADIMINVHIAGTRVTLSLDSSGESLHKRGWRVGQTEAPINEVLAAGIILKSGWRGGDLPLVDPMCGSGTFLVEAAMIATGTMPGIYRRRFAFEQWDDFDEELFDSIYNDESSEKEYTGKIYGSDISPKAVEIAAANLRSAGMSRYVDLRVKPLAQWSEAPEAGKPGVLVTNPPYGERISVENMEAFYELIGTKLKFVFKGYHAWIIGYRKEYFDKIGLAPSLKEPVYNGSLECELREYIIFEGDYKQFRAQGGHLRLAADSGEEEEDDRRDRRQPDSMKPRRKFRGERDDSREFRRNDRREERGDRYGRRDDRRSPKGPKREKDWRGADRREPWRDNEWDGHSDHGRRQERPRRDSR
ncbi:MAG: THUMP domain-containing protein, partial [Clostridium sp.]|nr:THUMP domain-containing protein [Clostridium sp.]